MIEIILSIIVIILCIIIIYTFSEEKWFTLLISVLGFTYAMKIGTLMTDENDVDPLEVYRGNTKLEITEKIVNGKVIERDSTVVLK